MPEFRTNKNGKPYPITPKKGGAAAVAAAALGAGVIAVDGGFAGSGSAGIAGESAGAQALRAKSGSSKAEASKGRYGQAWSRLGWKQIARKAEKAIECAANSYGDVQQFFLRAPCKKLDRVLLTVADGQGGTIVVAIAWVTMTTANDAQRLKDLADTDGTGSVSPRAATLLDMASVKFTGDRYDSDRRGAMTVIAEAAPAGGDPDIAAMDLATEIAVVFPPP